jgi:hypothetical protein
MSVDSIDRWHACARPEPTYNDFNVQLGCHFEEFREMLAALTFETGDPLRTTEALALLDFRLKSFEAGLKDGRIKARPADRKGLLDSLCDQIVTAVGVGYCAKMDVPPSLEEVNRSNWSKFVEGVPLRDANGKITKGPNYTPPYLEGAY